MLHRVIIHRIYRGDRLILLILCFLGFFSCNFGQNYRKDSIGLSQIENSESDAKDSLPEFGTLDSVQTGLNFLGGSNYVATKRNLVKLRSRLNQRKALIVSPNEKVKFIDSISGVFTANLLNEIVPYWYGTEWDFEGHTSIPNIGQIACGYFVSTTLKDMGLKMNRYRFAQADPLTEAKSYAIDTANFYEFERENFNNLAELLSALKGGLYFVGLDNHVGYFYKKDGKHYFIHANFVDGKVMIEVAERSIAFTSSKYYFAKISSNRALALKWVMGSRIEIAN